MYSEEKHNIEKISLARDDIDFDTQEDKVFDSRNKKPPGPRSGRVSPF
jgi:hypothetical protein